jgi:hypothetical protein
MKLSELIPGKATVYYTGLSLATVCDKDDEKYERSVADAAAAVFELYQRDEVNPTQRKLESGEFEYLVTRKRLPSDPEMVKQRRAYISRMEVGGDTYRPSRHER